MSEASCGGGLLTEEVAAGLFEGSVWLHRRLDSWNRLVSSEVLYLVRRYEHFALFENEIGIRECACYFDIRKDFELWLPPL